MIITRRASAVIAKRPGSNKAVYDCYCILFYLLKNNSDPRNAQDFQLIPEPNKKGEGKESYLDFIGSNHKFLKEIRHWKEFRNNSKS